MNGRALAAAAFSGVGAVAIWTWLSARPDSELSRWSSIASVVACVFVVITLVAVVIPLISGGDDKDDKEVPDGDSTPRLPLGPSVTQGINNYGAGTVNAQSQGFQLNIDQRQPPGNGQ